MYWIIHIIILSVLSFLVWKFSKSTISKSIFLLGLVVKLGAGIVLGFVFYNFYGTGDTIAFFETAKSNESLNLNQPRTEFFIQLIAPLIRLSGGSYWISSLWLSFISFCSCWYLATNLSYLYPKIKPLIIGCFLFIPTVIFWSSGILKDTLTFSAIAFMVSVLQKIYQKRHVQIFELLLLLIAGFLLIKLKHYLFITILLYGGLLVAISIVRAFSTKWKWVMVLTTLLVVGIASQNVHPYLKIDRLAWAIFENNKAILAKTDPEKQVDLQIQDDSWKSVGNTVPKAIYLGLFRPSLFDNVPKWGLIHQVENFILSILLIFSLILLLKRKNVIDIPMTLSAIACILLLAVLLSLTTPNFGTLVRYKNAYLPYLFLLCSILPYRYLTSSEEE